MERVRGRKRESEGKREFFMIIWIYCANYSYIFNIFKKGSSYNSL